jgi:hypothetical protein
MKQKNNLVAFPAALVVTVAFLATIFLAQLIHKFSDLSRIEAFSS